MAQAYPSRPIKIIVPYPPGGATDIVARLVGERLGSALGQTAIVDNRSGASGKIGMQAAKTSPPDGYTLVMGTTTNLSILPNLTKDLGYDTLVDYVPIAQIATFPNVVVVNPNQPFKTVPELIEYARKNPGKLSYASSGIGTTQHLSAAMLSSLTGIDMVHVPYRGSSPALTDLMGGVVQLAIDNYPATVAFTQSGRLRAIAVTGSERLATLPDVPTVSESVPGSEASISFGLLAPKGTPPEVLRRLNAAIVAVARSPEIGERIAQLGGKMAVGSAADYQAYIVRETQKWKRVITEQKITLE